ncbi:MAG: DUF7333 family protein [Halobacteriota archaeon]
MKLDTVKAAAAFVAVVAVGAAALIAAPMMQTDTVLTMVVPSMVVYGAVMFLIGVLHGQYRESESGLGLSL